MNTKKYKIYDDFLKDGGEGKWQKKWEKSDLYKADDSKKDKQYLLVEFPYPSGAGLHVGHARSYTALDIMARKLRMEGKNVMYPIGWDAFGLPTENYAIKNKIHPRQATEENVATFTKQLKALGFSFDWSREINTTDPEYYKWTQWIFLQLYKKDLAYKKKMAINWCPSCKIGLAHEEVVDGKCERCGAEVEQRDKEQWMLAITKYADRLIKDLDTVDYLDKIKTQQVNWIGRSEGASLKFQIAKNKKQKNSKSQISNHKDYIEVFTTRPDTLFGATYMVLAPEHGLVEQLKDQIENLSEVKKYIKEANKKNDLQRTSLEKDKTGVELKGIKAINPANNEEIPVWIADYVLASYGTGAIMAVPAHDERDWEFAKKFNIEIRQVILTRGSVAGSVKIDKKGNAQGVVQKFKDEWNDHYVNEGKMINSSEFDGMDSEEVKKKITKKVGGKITTQYKLRDWIFSRQHYWGEPIPIIYCEQCAKQKEQVLILHGWEDNSKSGFIPSLKKNLETKGYEVFVFDAPNTSEPNFDEWYSFIKEKIKIKQLKNFHLIGHSMGGHLALKIAEEQKLQSLTLVAPVGFSPSDEYFKQFKDELTEKELEVYKKFQDHSLSIKKLKENVGNINFIFGEKDDWITEEIRNYYQNNFQDLAEIKILSNYKHFSENEGVKKLQHVEDLFSINNSGEIPVPEKDLPVKLPDVKNYEPTDTGESPLAAITDWVNTKCPKCKGNAKRETDTMPNWAGSSWYFLRYCDPNNDKEFASQTKLKQWMPIDLYNGGMEHTTLHLLYSRFWNKFLYDQKLVPVSEPYAKRVSHGMVLAEDGKKMSKSLGNVINPDEIIENIGADSLRLYEMFMGPFAETIPWSTEGVKGVRRFLEKVFSLESKVAKSKVTTTNLLHKTIKKVAEDIDNMKFNTAISAMMIFVNEAQKEGISKEDFENFLIILAPFAPHITEELFESLGNKESIFKQPWPKYDEKLIQDETIQLVVQVNGKVRDNIEVESGISEEEAKEKALASEQVKKWTEDKEVVKIIFVKNKLVNIVVK